MLKNQWEDDWVIRHCVARFFPPTIASKVSNELQTLGGEVLHPQLFAWVTSAEQSPPKLLGDGRDSFGRPATRLMTNEGWRMLSHWGLERGFVAVGYEDSFSSLSEKKKREKRTMVATGRISVPSSSYAQ